MTRAAKWAYVAVGTAVVVALPFFVGEFRSFELARVGIFFIAILGLDVLTGSSGQISLGHGAFMAIGGYTSAILMARHGVLDVKTIPAAALVGAAIGAVTGIPALRLRGLYLALATFGIAVALPSLIKKAESFTGGSTGLSLFGQLSGHGAGYLGLSNNDWLYALTWGIAIPLFLLAWALLSGRFGRAVLAVRDNELAAAASGVHRATYKVAAFAVAAAYAGVAGSLFGIVTAYVSPDTFPITLSLYLLVGAVVGGYGSIWGAIVGALLIQFLPDVVRIVPHVDPKQPGRATFFFGAILVALMIVLPLITRLTNRVYARGGS